MEHYKSDLFPTSRNKVGAARKLMYGTTCPGLEASISPDSKTQSWARGKTVETTRPCFQATILIFIAILLYCIWCGYLPYLDTETKIFFEFFLVPEALFRCREALKLLRAQALDLHFLK